MGKLNKNIKAEVINDRNMPELEAENIIRDD